MPPLGPRRPSSPAPRLLPRCPTCSGCAMTTGARASRTQTSAKVSFDSQYVYVTELHRLRRITISDATVTTLAGSTSSSRGSTVAQSCSFDAAASVVCDGTGTAAGFNHPVDMVVAEAMLYVSDRENNRIRSVSVAAQVAVVQSFAGGAGGDSDGQGTNAGIRSPQRQLSNPRPRVAEGLRGLRVPHARGARSAQGGEQESRLLITSCRASRSLKTRSMGGCRWWRGPRPI